MDSRMKTHGQIAWMDLMCEDVDAVSDFYTGVLGWESEVMDVGMSPYTVFSAGGVPVAGLMAKPPTGPEPCAPNARTSCMTVEDVDARSVVLNGSLDIPSVGRMAIIQDPYGDVIGIMAREVASDEA